MPHPPQYRLDSISVGQAVSVYIQHALTVLIICTLLLSVDEVANQLEIPFRFIPIDHIMKSYKDDGARCGDDFTQVATEVTCCSHSDLTVLALCSRCACTRPARQPVLILTLTYSLANPHHCRAPFLTIQVGFGAC